MAKNFMIRFLYEGKPSYANVFEYDCPMEYHVQVVNSILHNNLPERLVLIQQNEKLCLQVTDHIPVEFVDRIVESIEEHLSK